MLLMMMIILYSVAPELRREWRAGPLVLLVSASFISFFAFSLGYPYPRGTYLLRTKIIIVAVIIIIIIIIMDEASFDACACMRLVPVQYIIRALNMEVNVCIVS